MSAMLFLMFVQSLFQFGAKEEILEGYYGDKNYLDMFFYMNCMLYIIKAIQFFIKSLQLSSLSFEDHITLLALHLFFLNLCYASLIHSNLSKIMLFYAETVKRSFNFFRLY